jgi:hypothetical protein
MPSPQRAYRQRQHRAHYACGRQTGIEDRAYKAYLELEIELNRRPTNGEVSRRMKVGSNVASCQLQNLMASGRIPPDDDWRARNPIIDNTPNDPPPDSDERRFRLRAAKEKYKAMNARQIRQPKLREDHNQVLIAYLAAKSRARREPTLDEIKACANMGHDSDAHLETVLRRLEKRGVIHRRSTTEELRHFAESWVRHELEIIVSSIVNKQNNAKRKQSPAKKRAAKP